MHRSDRATISACRPGRGIATLGIAAIIVGLVLMHSMSFDEAGAQMRPATGMAYSGAHGPMTRMASTVAATSTQMAGAGCGTEHARECIPAPTRRSAVLLDGASAIVAEPPGAETDAVGLARFAPSEWRPARSRPVTVLRL